MPCIDILRKGFKVDVSSFQILNHNHNGYLLLKRDVASFSRLQITFKYTPKPAGIFGGNIS